MRGNFSWRLPLFAWKQLRDKKEAIGRGSFGLVCAIFYAATKTHGKFSMTKVTKQVYNEKTQLSFVHNGSLLFIPLGERKKLITLNFSPAHYRRGDE